MELRQSPLPVDAFGFETDPVALVISTADSDPAIELIFADLTVRSADLASVGIVRIIIHQPALCVIQSRATDRGQRTAPLLLFEILIPFGKRSSAIIRSIVRVESFRISESCFFVRSSFAKVLFTEQPQ